MRGEPGTEEEEAGGAVAPRGRTLFNAGVRLSTHLATLLLGLYTVGFIVRSVGVELYGLIGVVNAMVGYASVVTVALTSTVGREVAFAIEARNLERASRDLSTAVFGTLAALAIAIPVPAMVGLLLLDQLFVVPPGQLMAARVLLGLTLITFVLTTVSGPVGVAMFVRNRLDLTGGVSLLRAIAYLAAMAALMAAPVPLLVAVGLAGLLAAALALGLHLAVHRSLLRAVTIHPRSFDWQSVRRTLAVGGWLTLSQIGALLILQSDVVVANVILGTTAAGQLAALTALSLQVRALVGIVSSLFAPDQVVLAARGHEQRFAEYLFQSIRVVTLFVGLLVGVYCGVTSEFLFLWLGPEFAELAPLSWLMMVPLIPILGSMPAWNALIALGKVRAPALLTLIMGILAIGFSVLLAGPIGLGLVGIVVSGVVMLAARNLAFVPWYLHRFAAMDPWRQLRATIEGMVAGGLGVVVTAGARALLPEVKSVWSLAGAVVIGTVVTGGAALPALRTGFRRLKSSSEGLVGVP